MAEPGKAEYKTFLAFVIFVFINYKLFKMKKIVLYTFILCSSYLFSQTRAYRVAEVTVENRENEKALLKLFDKFYQGAKFKSGGKIIQKIIEGREPGGSTHRIVTIYDLGNFGRVDGDFEPQELEDFLTTRSLLIKSTNKIYSGRVLNVKNDKKIVEDEVFHIYDIIPKNPFKFSKAYEKALKGMSGLSGDRRFGFGTYDIGKPNGATHWTLVSGKSPGDIIKSLEEMFTDYGEEFFTFLNERGEVRDVKDFLLRNLRVYM